MALILSVCAIATQLRRVSRRQASHAAGRAGAARRNAPLVGL